MLSMTKRTVDSCLVGQGLAGTTLAWTMLLRGESLLIIDRDDAVTASRIAAGLLTPITGPKLALTLYWNECREIAERFYQRIEAQTGESLLACRPAVHLFRSAAEQELFHTRLQSPDFKKQARPLLPNEIPSFWNAPWGGFEMPHAAQLNVARYLDVSRKHFIDAGCFQPGQLDPATDLQITADTVRIPRWNVFAETLIFCQGWTPSIPHWFENVQFRPAKGEILTLNIPGMRERRSIHSGCWLASGAETGTEYRLGSTFEWQQLDQSSTPQARDALLTRLSVWLKLAAEVTGQQAAVRPTMHDFHPVLGRHPEQSHIGILNGLGTKGSLMAPWLAELLVDHWKQGRPLPAELDVQRWFR